MSYPKVLQGRLEKEPLARKALQCAEFIVLFAVPLVFLLFAMPKVGDNPVARQGIVWVANVAMLVIVYLGLRLRGQTWSHFGLAFGKPRRAAVTRTLLLSLAVFAAATAVFVLGSIVAAQIPDIRESADMSGYNYLYHNLPLLIVSLIGVYIVSSFGEEVIYRGFLITRIEEMGPGGKGVRWLAVLISAAVFGLVHFDWGPVGIGQAAFVGLVFAIAYLKVKRNLWINILAHGYMDTILLVQLSFVQGPH
jgi:membrane protease YdiL (CAAX protease family)